MVATVIGTATRAGPRWLHLDVGAFNGMMESLETGNPLRYPVTDSQRRRGPGPLPPHRADLRQPGHDAVRRRAVRGPRAGDRVYIHSAGAYTTCYASTFNGFDLPPTYVQPVSG